MSDWDYDPETGEFYEAAPPRDNQIDAAKEVLLARFFPDDGENVYYGRQLEILLEEEFFHWITKKALNELAQSRLIATKAEATPQFTAHFYWPRRYRYPRRKVRETLELIAAFSRPQFGDALGQVGESLVDAGFATIGFRILSRNVREVDGKRWRESNHDLDRLVERDGVRYGVEIKNTLGYISTDEFEIKLKMAAYFGVRPMFIARMMPKTYVHAVWQQGGFCLLLKNQHYPYMSNELMQAVREKLNFPVTIVRNLADGTLARFETWHERHLPNVN